MKIKIFIAFIAIIVAALLSNFLFEWLIIKDFDTYVAKVKTDQFYWVLNSVEDSYFYGTWNRAQLEESVHWGMMLGLNIKVIDAEGEEIISSEGLMSSLSEGMERRMKELFHVHKGEGTFYNHPLHSRGQRIGTLLWQPFEKKEIREQELVFKRRTKFFLLLSFIIAGGGALILALLFSQYLSKPISDLKNAADKIARGEFNVRIPKLSSGKHYKFLGSEKDEVESLSEAFNQMAESLEKEEKVRKHLMSNVAHELRTPLTIMRTQVEAIADGIVEKDKGLENIQSEIERLTRLVGGIEDVTLAEASFLAKSDCAEIDLQEFLSGLSQEMLPAFKEKGLEITVASHDCLEVCTDPEKLERIVRNLLSNALKFTERGGVSLGYGLASEHFFIEVKDTGKGIPEHELPNIFNRFYRGEKAVNNGLGLGLAIVKELTMAMEGKIEVSSKVNEGTTFRLMFPCVKQQA